MKTEQHELETIILALMLLHKETAATVLAAGITPEFFTAEMDQEIFSVQQVLFIEATNKISFIDLKSKLRPALANRLKAVKETVMHGSNPKAYIDEFCRRRWIKEVVASSVEMHAFLRANEKSPNQEVVCAKIVKFSEDALNKGTVKKPFSMPVSIDETLASIEKQIELIKAGGSIGIPSQFSKLNDLITGFLPGRLYVLAARPGVGKTTFAMNLASHMLKNEKAVIFSSLEMGEEEIQKKFISEVGRIDVRNILSAKLNDSELDRITAATMVMHTWKLTLIDDFEQTFESLRVQAKIAKMKNSLDAIFVDYLTLLDSVQKHENLRIKINYMTKGFKALAKELAIPVVILAQLNRNIESAKDRRKPMLSDLKESGSIEQDADVVMFIDRPGMYSDAIDKRVAVIYVEKNRSGPRGEVGLFCDMQLSRFYEGSK